MFEPPVKRHKLLIFSVNAPDPLRRRNAKNQQFAKVPFRGFRGKNGFSKQPHNKLYKIK